MTRLLAAALAAFSLAACGGGDAGTVATDPPRTPAPSSPAPVGPTASASTARRHGSAVVEFRGMRHAWSERACEATRDTSGKVVGWMATFQDVGEQARPYRMGVTDSRRYVQIRVRGYRGAGTYDSAAVSVRLVEDAATPALATGFGTPGQRLVLRAGGREGTYTSKRLKVDVECDPADDTSTEAGQAVAERPAAGSAYVVRPEGAVFVFRDVRCAKSGGGTSVVAGTFPHFFRVVTGAKDGAPGGARVLFAVHGVVIPFTAPNATAEVTGSPVTAGTFRYSPSGPNATTDVTRGAFACG